MSEAKLKNRRNCCISHEFFNAATANLHKIAVVHAQSSDTVHPPVYEGDHCFTFSDVLDSVNYLTSRLCSIFAGGADPHLSVPHPPAGESDSTDKSAKYVFVPIQKRLKESIRSTRTPKIVGIYMAPSVEYIVSVLSVLRCGEAFLPLDPSWPKDRVLSIINSSNVGLIITCGNSVGGRGSQNSDEAGWLVECDISRVLYFSMDKSLKDQVAPLKLAWPCENERERLYCYLMYTSGSTGTPKGVCGTEIGVLNRFLWMQELYPLHGEEILLFKTSISFIDHVQEFIGPMLTACTVVVPPFYELKDNLVSIITFLKDYSINRVTTVPSFMRAIIPALQRKDNMQLRSSLKLIVLSGEAFPLSLWKNISSLLPETSLLNLYGSTEVSGDCTYFDCKRLPKVMEREELTTVPIGVPIFNCDVVLIGTDDRPEEGEIYVGGLCVCSGYLCEPNHIPVVHKWDQNSTRKQSLDGSQNEEYFKTGDLAQRLQCGDLVFSGRIDRTVKVNGQRIALEEVESALRGHPDVADAAVVSQKSFEELLLLQAFIVLKNKELSGDVVWSSIRNLVTSKLPRAMIPNSFMFRDYLPMSSSGKVDYASLRGSTSLTSHVQYQTNQMETTGLLQRIKEAFCNALMIEKVSDDDDFFMLGGNSLAAAHVSYNLGIDMRSLKSYSSPSKLLVLLETQKSRSAAVGVDIDSNSNLLAGKGEVQEVHSATHRHVSPKPHLLMHGTPTDKNGNHTNLPKRLKVETHEQDTPKCFCPSGEYLWDSSDVSIACSFTRCNKILYKGSVSLRNTPQATWLQIPRKTRGSLKEFWKVDMKSCVDASPVVVFKDGDTYLFIGSHSRKFLCINAKSGSVQWETVLDGRIECSAAVTCDFSQVVVGCFKGKIYFLDFVSGSILWTFQTCGEVKSQPVIDLRRQLVWCGSHDHNLYALDYRNHCCVFKLPCGGSIYGSPAIDEEILYVASTSGRVTALSLKEFPFCILWEHELKVPVFGSLVVIPDGPIISCSVDGYVVALDSSGSTVWRSRTDGPIFAGACISQALPSQVLISCRSGSVYSFEQETGKLLWKFNVGDPVTASVYIEEHLQLRIDSSVIPDRLVCVCTSSGNILVLRINSDAADMAVEEFSRFKLQGDIFSSPVMIGGSIFVGCRDDYIHCITVDKFDQYQIDMCKCRIKNS